MALKKDELTALTIVGDSSNLTVAPVQTAICYFTPKEETVEQTEEKKNDLTLFAQNITNEVKDLRQEMRELRQEMRGYLTDLTSRAQLSDMKYGMEQSRMKILGWKRHLTNIDGWGRIILLGLAIMIYVKSNKDGLFGYLKNEDLSHTLKHIVLWASFGIFCLLIISNLYYMAFWEIKLSNGGCASRFFGYLQSFFGKIKSYTRIEIVCLLSMVLGVMNPTVYLAMMIGGYLFCDILLSLAYKYDEKRNVYEMEKYLLSFIFDEKYDNITYGKSFLFASTWQDHLADAHTKGKLKQWDCYLQSRFLLFQVFCKYLITFNNHVINDTRGNVSRFC